MSEALNRWYALVSELNGRPLVGTPGIRDVDHPCEEYDGKGYDGRGRCDSDGHYECVNCSHLRARRAAVHSGRRGTAGSHSAGSAESETETVSEDEAVGTTEPRQGIWT